MKYFTSTLWEEMQHSESRDRAEKEWDENVELYKTYFTDIKRSLPKSFLKIFDKECGFHDFSIKEINTTSCTRKTVSDIVNVTIIVSNGKNQYDIMLKNVEILNINIINKLHCICGRISWGYSEFELLENQKIELRIICDVHNEICF